MLQENEQGIFNAKGSRRVIRDCDRYLAVMGSDGDTKTIWDKDRPAEVRNAKKTFERLTGEGYNAYTVNREGNKGELVRDFDPDAEGMIFVPQMVGG